MVEYVFGQYVIGHTLSIGTLCMLRYGSYVFDQYVMCGAIWVRTFCSQYIIGGNPFFKVLSIPLFLTAAGNSEADDNSNSNHNNNKSTRAADAADSSDVITPLQGHQLGLEQKLRIPHKLLVNFIKQSQQRRAEQVSLLCPSYKFELKRAILYFGSDLYYCAYLKGHQTTRYFPVEPSQMFFY